MKIKSAVFTILFILICISCTQREGFSELKGPYLNQRPPGLIAEVFAPGLISTSKDEAYPCFALMGNAFYFKSDLFGG